jgi:hypothetical protein
LKLKCIAILHLRWNVGEKTVPEVEACIRVHAIGTIRVEVEVDVHIDVVMKTKVYLCAGN